MEPQLQDIVLVIFGVVVALIGAFLALWLLSVILNIIFDTTIFLFVLTLFVVGYIVRMLSWLGRKLAIPIGFLCGMIIYNPSYFLFDQDAIPYILFCIVAFYLLSLILHKLSVKVTEIIKDEMGWFEDKVQDEDDSKHSLGYDHHQLIEELKRMSQGQRKDLFAKIHSQLFDKTNKYSLDRRSYLKILHFLAKKEGSSNGKHEREEYENISAGFLTLANRFLKDEEILYIMTEGKLPPL